MHVAATRIDVDYLQFYQSLVKSSIASRAANLVMMITRKLSPIAEYTQQYAIKFITAVGDEYMTILDTSWSIIGNVALFFTRYCHRVKGNKQHVGIDNTQQRRHLSVENAAEVAYECV